MGRATKQPIFEVPRLTEAQRADARAKLLADVERAQADGVYEEAQRWRGKVQWSVSLERLRDDDD